MPEKLILKILWQLSGSQDWEISEVSERYDG